MAPTPNAAEEEQIVFKWMYGDVLNSPKFSKFSASLNPMRWSAQATQDEFQGQIMSANPAERDGNTMKRPIRVAWRAASGKGVFTCASYSELRAEIARIRGHEARVAERKAQSEVTGFQAESESTGFQSEQCSAFQSELMGVGEFAAPESVNRDAVEALEAEEQQAATSGPRSWRLAAGNRSDGRPPQMASAA